MNILYKKFCATIAILFTVFSCFSQTNILFSDNLTRTNGSLSPWVVYSGTVSITNNTLVELNNNGYSYAYIPTNFTNFTLITQMSFGSAANWGGGIGARLNTATGAHYAAWIYPSGSGGGPNVVKLLNFSNWTTWTLMTQVNIASFGTGTTSLSMVCSNNLISVYMGGIELITNFADSSYTSGAIDLEGSSSTIPNYYYPPISVFSLINTASTNSSSGLINSNYANVTLAWNISTNSIVAGYNIYYGGASGVYTNETSVAQPINTLTISNLTVGNTYYFAATTYSAVGAESALSSEVFYTVPNISPTNTLTAPVNFELIGVSK